MLVLKAFFVVFGFFVIGSFFGFLFANYRWRRGRCGLCGAKGENCECM